MTLQIQVSPEELSDLHAGKLCVLEVPIDEIAIISGNAFQMTVKAGLAVTTRNKDNRRTLMVTVER